MQKQEILELKQNIQIKKIDHLEVSKSQKVLVPEESKQSLQAENRQSREVTGKNIIRSKFIVPLKVVDKIIGKVKIPDTTTLEVINIEDLINLKITQI